MAENPTPPAGSPPSTDPEVVVPEIVVGSGARSIGQPTSPSMQASDVEIFIGQDKAIDEARLRVLTDPFTRTSQNRPLASEIIRPDTQGNATLLRQFVTPKRLEDLWEQIDKLQKDVIKRVTADRSLTDAYQMDLLFASSLLLQSTANYEEVRQIVFRVEADLSREQVVTASIFRFRPRLQVYYVLVTLLTLLAFGLDTAYRTLIPESMGVLRMAWLPVLFGVLGASFNGMMALHEHTTVRRDFDPLHISWYVLNPLMGGVLGMIVFIFFVVTSTTFNPELPSYDRAAPLVIWLLAFAVGWQQNLVFRMLNRLLKTVFNEQETKPADQRPVTTAGKSDGGAGSRPNAGG